MKISEWEKGYATGIITMIIGRIIFDLFLVMVDIPKEVKDVGN